MKYGGEKHNRRSIRLSGHNYTQSGAYFVTVCTQNRACLFGAVVDCEMQLNDAGRIVQKAWSGLPGRFSQINVDSFVVMPNHIHGIIVVGAQFIAPSNTFSNRVEEAAPGTMNHTPTVGEIIRTYKAVSTRAIRCTVNVDFRWQRNYYEHIVRNEESLNHIRQYIVDNPIRWDLDRDNPAVITPEPKDAWRLP